MKSSSLQMQKAPPDSPLRIIRDCRAIRPPVVALHTTALRLYSSEHVSVSQKTSLILCSDAKIQALNEAYRGIDRATDVLSFSFCDPDLLGEIYISLPTTAAQAKEYGVNPGDELLRLFIHGFFHLLGYDHENRADRLKMEKKERKYLPPSAV